MLAAMSDSAQTMMTRIERVHAELDILGLDVTGHVLDPYAQLLAERVDGMRARRVDP